MITISKNANTNYLCKIVRLDKLVPIEGADRIQLAIVDFQDVVVSKDVQKGEIMIYFPIECAINKDFLSHTNVFRDATLNEDKESKGFFDDKGRVKAIKMIKGTVRSMGYVVPAETVYEWAYGGKLSDDMSMQDYFIENVNKEFDTINNKLLVEKYIVPIKGTGSSKQGKKPRVSRIIDGQVLLHASTDNLRKNMDKIRPTDVISVTYKTHGTSGTAQHVLVKRSLNWIEKLAKKLGVKVQEVEYDLVYTSRRVVKNSDMDDTKKHDHFYNYDIWGHVVEKNDLRNKIPKGYSLYYEILGYDKDGGFIQGPYDYGCKQGEHKLEVYRITYVNPDGIVTEMSFPEIAEFCNRAGLEPSHLFYWGQAKDMKFPTAGLLDYTDEEQWREYFIKCLEEDYNEKDCFMCSNKLPEEGIVVRKESLFNFEAYKLKSFSFLQRESADLDKGISDIESEN